MSHYVYKIINKIDGMCYYGSHSWKGDGVDKNYYGSGTRIKDAIEILGKEYFCVIPLGFYNTAEESKRAELNIIQERRAVEDDMCYNMVNIASLGNSGRTLSSEHKKHLSESLKGENHPRYGKTGNKHPFFGKHHSEETKTRISDAIKGEKCYMYGKPMHEKARKALDQYRKTKAISVVAINKSTKCVHLFKSIRDADRCLGVNQSNIGKCIKGEYKSTGGYTFKRINREPRVFKLSVTGINSI